MFEGLRYAFPIAFLLYGTMLIGGGFVALAWIEFAFVRPRKTNGLYILTASVLLDTLMHYVGQAAPVGWPVEHHDLWIFRQPGMVMIGSGVLFVINLFGFVWLISAFCDSLSNRA
jgi:hypothetical protein